MTLMAPTTFKNREDAGYQLAKLLHKYHGSDAIVLGIPRGGVIPASIIANELSLPLGLLIVRKIGHQYNPEYAIGGISESGSIIKNEDEIDHIDKVWFDSEAKAQLKEAKRRREKYWGSRPTLNLKGKTTILVDDGLATGLTMETAIKELKSQNPKKIIVAVPVSPRDTANQITEEVDDYVSILTPELYAGSVGAYYEEFPQIEDEEVIQILNKHQPINPGKI